MKQSEEKRSRANIYFSGMSELNARIEASVVILKPVYSTISNDHPRASSCGFDMSVVWG
jgi:hypothetical protein